MGGGKGFDTGEPGTEFLKLHGSVDWLRGAVSLEDMYSVLEFLIFFSEPFRTSLRKTAAWVAHENSSGVRLLMNIGISKEQLYITPPFTEIFSRFQAKLGEAGIIVQLKEQLIELAKQTPGYELPSLAFGELHAEIKAGLQTVRDTIVSLMAHPAEKAPIGFK